MVFALSGIDGLIVVRNTKTSFPVWLFIARRQRLALRKAEAARSLNIPSRTLQDGKLGQRERRTGLFGGRSQSVEDLQLIQADSDLLNFGGCRNSLHFEGSLEASDSGADKIISV